MTLQDPQSGAFVHICQAQLGQRCRLCGLQLEGGWAMSTEDTGWCCLHHLERVLLDMPTSPEFRAKAAARELLRDANPGDTVTVSSVLLAAVRTR